MAKKVLLVEPSDREFYKDAKVKEVVPNSASLTLATIAASILGAGHDAQVIDLGNFVNPSNALKEKLESYNPDVIGVTASTPLFGKAAEVVELAKKLNENILAVAGGPHVSGYPKESLEKSKLDIAIMGEGDLTIVDVLNDVELKEIKGIAYKDKKGNAVINESRPLIENLDEIPLPAWHLFDVEKSIVPKFVARNSPVGWLESSRGCIYGCVYCLPKGTPVLTSKLEWIPIEEIKVNDKIIGVKEALKSRTKFIRVKVKSCFKRKVSEIYKIVTERGTLESTGEHPWLTVSKRWRNAQNLKVGWKLRDISLPIIPKKRNDAFFLGYLKGISRGDGCFWMSKIVDKKRPKFKYSYLNFRLALKSKEPIDFVEQLLKRFNIYYVRGISNSSNGLKMHHVSLRKEKEAKKFKRLIKWQKNDEFYRGFISGIFDAEGSWGKRHSTLRITNYDKQLVKLIAKLLRHFGFKPIIEQKGLRVNGGFCEDIRFFAFFKPIIQYKKDNIYYQTLRSNTKIINLYKEIGSYEVHNLETTSGNFIAGGFVTHNCTKSIFKRVFRTKSVERVIQEVEHMKKFGFKEFHIADDCFTTDMERAEKICDEMIKRKLNTPWVALTGIRVDRVNETLLKKMREAGCYRLFFGIESGNQEILKRIKKNINLEQVRTAVKMANKAGIEAWGSFMIGLPGETEQTMQDTIDFAKSLDLDMAKLTITIPLPATELYNEYLSKGLMISEDWNKFNLYTPARELYRHENLDWDTIEKYYKKFYKEFYFRPGYLWHRLMHDIKTGMLVEHIKIMLKTTW